MKTSLLGKSKSSNKIGKNLLDPIKRQKICVKHGVDIWNIYDFMYLDKRKIPQLKILEVSIPYESDLIVESKSLKLYLNEFYKKTFKNKNELLTKIKKDLEDSIKHRIKIKFIKKFMDEPNYLDLNKTNLVHTKKNTILKFNGFRSICPVTSQPDFANIYIYLDKKINVEYLNKYLISFRDHGGFHEQCIDQIYQHINGDYMYTSKGT